MWTMTAPIIRQAGHRPADHRSVPLLAEPSVGHYPEFREFLTGAFGFSAFDLSGTPGEPGLLDVDGRLYEVVFVGRSGRPFPDGVEINALVPGVEPLDETAADLDLWAILQWLVDGVGGEWSTQALVTTGEIYRIPAVRPRPAQPVTSARERETLVFDLYGTLVDPLAVSSELALTLPRATTDAIAAEWRRTQIEYSFRLTVMNRYEDFALVTEHALDFALAKLGCTLTPDARAAVLARYSALRPFADVVPGLTALSQAGYTITLLSNGSPAMVRECLENSGLLDLFPSWMSVDPVGAFKPHPAVYRFAADAAGRPIGETRIVSSNPFDIVGAAAAGMRTAWINRSGVPFDTIGTSPEVTVGSLAELAAALTKT
jgi:2-haloacid dehalogenase